MSQSRNSRHPLLAVAGLTAALSLGLVACAQGGQAPSESPTSASTPASESASASPSASGASPAASVTETSSESASPTAAASTSTPAAVSPTASASASTPAAAAGETNVYWVALAGSDQQGVEFPGCDPGDLLVESTVPAKGSGEVGSTERVEAGIEALLQNREYEHSDGLVNALYQSELTLQDVSLDGDTVVVELSGQPMSSGTCDDPRIIGQLEYTAATNAGAYTAEVLVDGTPIQEFMSQKG